MRILTVIVLIAMLVSCQQATVTLQNPTPVTTSESEVRTINQDADRRWIETVTEGVEVGLWLPPHWAVDTSNGIILAEHLSGFDEGNPTPGMIMYLFVPPLDQFDIPQNSSMNTAYHVLDQVVRMPSELGDDAAATPPISFMWNDHPAAYYLLATREGIHSFVMAIDLPDIQRLLVINASVPSDQSGRIRAMLPFVLHEMTINGVQFVGGSLTELPNPLNFPRPEGETAFAPSDEPNTPQSPPNSP